MDDRTPSDGSDRGRTEDATPDSAADVDAPREGRRLDPAAVDTDPAEPTDTRTDTGRCAPA
jgi:hypothetical protein